MTNDQLVGNVLVIKHPEIFEGGNCLQTQISLLKIAPGMTLMSDGVKWCKKQSLFESLYYKGCMGCCYNSHLYGCLPAGPYICYLQRLSRLLEGKIFVLKFWQDRLSISGGGRGSQRRIIFPVAPSMRFLGPCWLWEWEEDTRFSIWLSGFGHEILVEPKEMRQASLHV